MAEEPTNVRYNASVVAVRRVHPELAVFRVLPDFGQLEFSAGQYTVLGLGAWEPCVSGFEADPHGADSSGKLIQRAYSISCSLLDEQGRLITATSFPTLEFYISLVRRAGVPPALTPRLFALKSGDRLFCGPHAHGRYGLGQIEPDDNIVFAATGTGEAPHNAMLAELLTRGHRGRIISVTCVRYRHDLAYLAAHRELEGRFSNYRYVTLTTREPENINPAFPGFVGKRYLQDYFASGDFERDNNCRLNPDDWHVFLCGSPDMIGAAHRAIEPAPHLTTQRGMVEILEQRGFHIDQPHSAGNIHFERYW
jgi:ferredoxin--NADP+ reductase